MEVEDKVQEKSSLLQDDEDVFDRTDIQRNNPMEDRDFDRNQGIVIDSSEEIFDKNESCLYIIVWYIWIEKFKLDTNL